MELGELSAKYESGRRGSTAVGWDKRGKLSLGKYQIAYGPGTLKKFLLFCWEKYPAIHDALMPLYKSITVGPSSVNGAFAKKWITLAENNMIQNAEYYFIKQSHFDRAFNGLRAELQLRVAENMALQQVLWSTSVQHGTKNAIKIFHQTFYDGIDIATLIDRIYKKRRKYLSKLKPRTRHAVLNRYTIECRQALKLLKEE